MLIAPLYLRVGDGARGLRVTATSYATSAQLVRVWAVARPYGPKKVAEFEPFELRPRFLERVATRVPSVGEDPYWLAILAFHRCRSAWERSASRHAGPFNVPEMDLAFFISDSGRDAMAVSVIYA
jgi:hypothetical protein